MFVKFDVNFFNQTFDLLFSLLVQLINNLIWNWSQTIIVIVKVVN